MQNKLSLIPFLKKNSLAILFVTLTLLITATGWMIYNNLKINTISIVGKEKDDVIRGIEILKGRNIFLLQKEETENILVAQNPAFRSVYITKSFPNSLKIDISYHTPLTYLDVKEGYMLLSSTGRVLEKIRDDDEIDSSYPIMTYYQSFPYVLYQAGDYIDMEDIRATLHVLQQSKRIGLKIQEVDIQSFYMIALEGEGITIYFSAEKKKERVSEEMKKIIKQLTLDGTQFRALNLRFDRPVIEYY